MAIVTERRLDARHALGARSVFASSDLDVQQGWFVWRLRERRFHGGCLGVVDGLKILVDRRLRCLGVLIDDELYSGLRHFNRNGINDHGMTLLAKICQVSIYAL